MNQLRHPPSDVQHLLNGHLQWLESNATKGRRLDTTHPEIRQRYDFTYLKLDTVDLSLAILDDTSFAGSSLTYAWCIGTSMRGTSLEECDLTAIRIEKADLERAILVGARLAGATIQEANEDLAYWTQAELEAGRKAASIERKMRSEMQECWTRAQAVAYITREQHKIYLEDNARQKRVFPVWDRHRTEGNSLPPMFSW